MFLSLDVVLDAAMLALMRRKWSALGLLLRMLIAFGYLAVFMVYIAVERAFPRAFSYWGVQHRYAGPTLYLLLWVLGYVLPRAASRPCREDITHTAFLAACGI